MALGPGPTDHLYNTGWGSHSEAGVTVLQFVSGSPSVRATRLGSTFQPQTWLTVSTPNDLKFEDSCSAFVTGTFPSKAACPLVKTSTLVNPTARIALPRMSSSVGGLSPLQSTTPTTRLDRLPGPRFKKVCDLQATEPSS